MFCFISHLISSDGVCRALRRWAGAQAGGSGAQGLENELKMVSYHLTKGEQLENILNNTFKEIEDITDVHQMTNQQLKRLIQRIEVDKDGNVDIYLRLLGDLGLDESVLIDENETILNCNDHT